MVLFLVKNWTVLDIGAPEPCGAWYNSGIFKSRKEAEDYIAWARERRARELETAKTKRSRRDNIVSQTYEIEEWLPSPKGDWIAKAV